MDENEYWGRLEFRISSELTLIAVSKWESLWCDGFLHQEYFLQGNPPRICGTAWMGGIPGQKTSYQETWQFSLFPQVEVGDRGGFDWSRLLPSEDESGWLSIDREARTLSMIVGRS